jgi:hypothetical protein
MANRLNAFRGKWRIISTDLWESAALDEFGTAYLAFGRNRTGELHLIALSASIDYRVGTRDGSPIVEFSWAGDDDGSPVSGRGWARRGPHGLIGRLFIHDGDDAEFAAKPFTMRGPQSAARRPSRG